MHNNKNFIIAFVLSMMILFGWQTFVAGPQEQERQAQLEILKAAEQAAQNTGQQNAGSVTTPAPVTTTGVVPSVPGSNTITSTQVPGALPAGISVISDALSASPRVVIKTGRLQGSINLKGGRLDDLLLADYRETIKDDSDLIRLFHPVGSDGAYYAEIGLVAAAGGPKLPTGETLWSVDGNRTLSADRPVTLTWDNGEGLTFRRTFEVDDNYMFKVTDFVKNKGAKAATVYPYGLVSRRGEPTTTGIWILHEGLIGFFGEDGLQQIDYDDLEDTPAIDEPKVDAGWLGITDKYWAAALVPPKDLSFKGRFASTKGLKPSYQADYLSDPVVVQAGGQTSLTTQLFAGAKETKLIDAYEKEANIKSFELLIDWGWFYFLTKPLFFLLDWLFGVVGNFGVAILMATVLIKIAFFWFANRSYVSMSRMKLLQPKMKEIQGRFGDDKPRQQQEMMKLYKQEKVNPLAGCWPVLIQIPVFFSLYKVLFVTIEMRHAPFFGWIHDLAAPDPTTIFNLFGLIPVALPEWMPLLGIWPILMGITMFVQMKLNPAPPDPTQQFIFNWMPVIFTIMLATFPAGLVIYWAWNNFLSVLQQYVIMTRQGVKVDMLGNIFDTFRKNKKSNQIEKTD